MSGALVLVIFIILVALAFDYINGFHDAANSIATVVSTRVLTPMQAVAWAAFFNFVAAFGFGVQVAKTVGKGVVESGVVDQWVILGGLVGALVLTGLVKITLFIVLAPVLGMALGFVLMVLTFWIFRAARPSRVDGLFRRLQLVSAAFYSLGHGTNDAQKTMGIIAILLFSGGYLGPEFYVPIWVVLCAHAAIGLGTMAGGWRIVKTMGMRITQLRPVGGFCAETAGAVMLIGTAAGGMPVSTTHTITGSIIGVGATRRFSAVRWGVAGRIVWAWILTIPLSGLLAAVTWLLLPHG